MKLVTVVIPVYGDWPSLKDCIESVKKNTSKKNTIILVNDCGPEVEEMEQNILDSIKGCPSFHYFRNKVNLGFVGTCNRAVNELDNTNNDILLLNSDTVVTGDYLDEMVDVLYASDKHGIVVPRSNNATLASIPLISLDADSNRDNRHESYETFKRISKLLPRFNVIPTGVGFCMLIRRDLIKNFGLFDPAYSLGYHEENDFSQRVNSYGYSAVLSNRSFVYHLESRSFSPEKKKALNEENEKILIKRYPYFISSVGRYFNEMLHPIDRFADIIGRPNAKKKLLINLFHFPLAFNGTTKSGHSFLSYLQKNSDPDIEITVFTQKEMANFHNLSSYGFRIVYPETIGDEIFHMSYCPGQVFHVETLLYMNRHCFKNIISLLDIIALRCDYLLSKDYKLRTIFLDSFKLSDKMIAISRFSKEDTESYFPEIADGITNKIQVIHMGFEESSFKNVEVSNELGEITSEEFVLVFGNSFKHKAVKETAKALEKYKKINFVFLGDIGNNSPPHIKSTPSGLMSDRALEKLIQKSKAIIFPSQYEGFGLPIVEAASNSKPLIYFDSEVGGEIVKMSGINTVFPFKYFEDLPNIVDKAIRENTEKTTKNIRSADDYNAEVFSSIKEELYTVETDEELKSRLNSRWSQMLTIHDYYYSDFRGYMPLRLRAIKSLERRSPKTHATLKRVYRRYRPAA